MNNLSKEQKQYFAGTVALILILSVVSFWHKPDLTVKDTAKTTKPSAEFLNSQAYLKYLNTIRLLGIWVHMMGVDLL